MTDKNIIQIGQMGQAQAAVESTMTSLQQVQNEAGVIATELMAMWTGDAAGGFGRALDKWLEDFGKCIEELNQIEQKLGGNKKIYAQNEANQNEHVQQLLAQIEV